jgi:membrane-associated phospholipid phosphatase
MAVGICVQFIDKEVALAIWTFTSSHPSLHRQFTIIPDTLPLVVSAGTFLLWISNYLLALNNRESRHLRFIQLASIALPSAFLVKLLLQPLFARTMIRTWLKSGGKIEPALFDKLHGGGFPSGHALVFTAFFTAVWICYPRLRPTSYTAISLLTLALLITSYHFAGDILAGICCGILITAGIHLILTKTHQPNT